LSLVVAWRRLTSDERWLIPEVAGHLGRDRKTIRAYLAGDRVAAVRPGAGVDRFDVFVDYCREAGLRIGMCGR
jgi:hypothetical protein